MGQGQNIVVHRSHVTAASTFIDRIDHRGTLVLMGGGKLREATGLAYLSI